MTDTETREGLRRLCDHHGDCPEQRPGCQWVQFKRDYIACECGGWDEFWVSRSNDTRLAGRTNHRRTCAALDRYEAERAAPAGPEELTEVLAAPAPDAAQALADTEGSANHEGSRSESDRVVERVQALADEPDNATVDAVLRVKFPALFRDDWRAKGGGPKHKAWEASMVENAREIVTAVLRAALGDAQAGDGRP